MGTSPWCPVLLYKSYPQGIRQGYVLVDVVKPSVKSNGDIEGEYHSTMEMPDTDASDLIELLRALGDTNNNQIGLKSFEKILKSKRSEVQTPINVRFELQKCAEIYLKLLRSAGLLEQDAQYTFISKGEGFLKFEHLVLPQVKWPKKKY